ncbi:imidazole glycerol phosphate synthase subunit HisH [Nubsella zeaxanthinifaciens]|uniref:imidazole glycerol phosphate synthase subunit HisH n=1 Tax=Nubsella zeaxanthinifaciens TaxID=392412 RepID=UPI003D03C8A4
MKKKTVIIDYGLGNLYSIAQACAHVGSTPVITSNREEIINSDSVILPGVGAFKVAMDHLNEMNLTNTIVEFANTGKPLMGVCLGMQLLFEQSQEFGEHAGLGIIPGAVKRFPQECNQNKLKIPHIGWNKLFKGNIEWEKTPLSEVAETDFMYFVHSYYAEPAELSSVLTYTYYQDFKYCSSVQKNNIFGFQFHPEKSGEAGLTIYKNFLSI